MESVNILHALPLFDNFFQFIRASLILKFTLFEQFYVLSVQVQQNMFINIYLHLF